MVEFCRRSPHLVVEGILQFSDHLAEISVPWQLNSKIKTKQPQNLLASTRWDNVFHFAFCSSLSWTWSLGSKVPQWTDCVWFSCLWRHKKPHCLSVTRVCKHFFLCFCCFSDFQMITFFFSSILVEFGLRVSSHLYFTGCWVSGP